MVREGKAKAPIIHSKKVSSKAFLPLGSTIQFPNRCRLGESV